MTANTWAEALQLASSHVYANALLITEVVMPEMYGHKLAERIQTHCPKIGCLCMSGYSVDVIANRGILEQGFMLIQMPFSKAKLAVKIRAAVDKPQPLPQSIPNARDL